ncbi:MAG: ImmA/IrrE family metallo-endopeptidase [Bacteroidetes bacterium]|nr:ImmA/IrrE family metallo-endopeptidase [Bacteroidota bacterium]
MSKVISAVKKVYSDCGISNPLQLPLEVIIESKNIIIKEERIDGADGRILMTKNSGVITLNASIDFPPRKRFILAHELGHFELHRLIQPVFSDNDETLNHSQQPNFNPVEAEANDFAAEFLMPTDLFHAECKGKKFDHNVIEHLANTFQVSKTAAILKFLKKDNGNHPVFVVCCQDNKMKWFKKTEDWLYFSRFQKGLPPPSGTVANEVFKKGFSYYASEAIQPIWKSDWFELKEREIDKEFFEYCLFVPSFNYLLSVIWEK